jgi:general secretion pathway protein A
MIQSMIVDEPGRADGYESFFGLREPPFSLSPNPRFRFASASHSAALAQAAAAIERREPLVVIIGDIGTGKTLLCRTMLQELRRRTFLSVVDDPMLGRDDLLEQLLQDFGIISKDRARLTSPTRHDLVDALQAFLRSLAPIGAHAVVIVDEAQHLQPEVLEQIRLLSNIDDNRGTLLQVMLVGQTDLDALLARPDLRQLQQRVSRRIRLEPLKGDEVREYIEHRLALARDEPSSSTPGAVVEDAAAAGPPDTGASVAFTPDAIAAVAQRSGGLPRVINLLCDRALEEAYQARVRTIDVPLIAAAAGALGLDALPATAGAPAPAEEPAGTMPNSSGFWGGAPIESGARAAHSEHEPEIGGAGPDPRPAVSSRSAWYIALAAAGGAAAVAIWIGVHAMRTPEAPAPPQAAAPVSTAAPSSTTPTDASQAPDAPRPQAAVPTEAPSPSPPAPSAAASAARAVPASEGHFEVVVGSFRTDARAAAVAAAAGALALPVRRRVSNGWQQVIAGPFASRADAESAREKLNRAGLTGAQIVPTEQ